MPPGRYCSLRLKRAPIDASPKRRGEALRIFGLFTAHFFFPKEKTAIPSRWDNTLKETRGWGEAPPWVPRIV